MAKNKNKKNKNLPAYNRRTVERIVIDLFSKNPTKIYNYKQIAKKLNIVDSRQRQLILEVLEKLKGEKRLSELYRGKYKYNAPKSIITGKVAMIQSGAAFVICDELEDDIFVNRNNTNGALNGDIVEVNIWARRKKKSPEGEILKIIKRGKTDYSGIVMVMKGHAFLDVTEKKMPYDIFIPLDKLNGAKDGQKAVARITQWATLSKNPEGEIIDVLGEVGENDAEMHSILAEYNLPYKFPEYLEEQAKKIDAGITKKEVAKREDFRKTLTFTIDPTDAKDFDDAISFKKLDNGNYEIGVHIADVSHYVEFDSAIDKEAYNRGTSVYLVDRTVPMLPEHLSNFICSLRPNEDKLTYSCIFEINEDAEVIKHRFAKTVINSDYRFDYEKAQELIETKKGDVAEEMNIINDITKKLKEKRYKEGSISFDKIEKKFEIDEKGKPIRLYFKEAKESNNLIEELMLLANKKAAEFAAGITFNEAPKSFVYRVHDEPDLEKLYTFSNFIKRFGYNFKIGSEQETAAQLNNLLYQVKGKDEQNVVENLAVRSMAKAVYTSKNIGHYGLAFDHYTHFTSPIRRYPDLMVHRLITRYLQKKKSVDSGALEQQCKHCSETEQGAANAERASIRYKEVEFMQDKLGYVFDGVITGVTERGLYVEISENKIEGMISIKDIDDDFYVFNDKNFTLIGQRKHSKYTLGDKVKIQITGASLQNRTLDFILAE